MASETSKPAARADKPAAATTRRKPAARPTARLAVAVADGSVRLLLMRSSGRTRHVPYLPTKARKPVAALRQQWKGGTPLATIAEEQGTSLATLRRRLLALDVSERVDAGDLDRLWDGKADAVAFTRGGAE